MEAKHTPGPWSVGRTRRYKHPGGVDGTEVAVHYGPAESRGNCIAFAYGHGATGDAEADARLIAAAPDLLEVLQEFTKYVHTEECSTDGAVTFSNNQINRLAFLARAAIAKATGAAA
jgi:hypothetical protein